MASKIFESLGFSSWGWSSGPNPDEPPLKDSEQKVAAVAENLLQAKETQEIGTIQKMGLTLLAFRLKSRKSEGEAYLSHLVGEEIIDGIHQYDQVLNKALAIFDIEKYLGNTSEAFTNCILPILIANLSHSAFPQAASKITAENLTTGIITTTLNEILGQLYTIDEAITNGELFEPALFVNFEETVLNLLLPCIGTWVQQGEVSYIHNKIRGPLRTILYNIYSKFLMDASSKNSDQITEAPDSIKIWPIVEEPIQKIAIHCLHSLAITTIEEEENYFLEQYENSDLTEILDLFIEPLAKRLHPKIPSFFKKLKKEEFEKILKALSLKLIGNILRNSVSQKQLLSTDQILKTLFEYFKNLISTEFQRINQLETRQVIQQADYEPIIENLLSTILNDKRVSDWVLKKFPIIKNLGAEFLFDLHEKFKTDLSESYKDRLRDFLWDETVFKEACPGAVKIPTDKKSNAEIIGTEEIVSQFYSITQTLAELLVDQLVLEGQNPVLQKTIFDKISEAIQLKHNPLTNPIFNVCFEIILNEDEVNINIRDFIKKWLGDSFFKWAVILIEKGGEVEGVKSRDKALFFATKFLLASLHPHFLSSQKSLQSSEEKTNEELNKIFWPISDELIRILQEDEGYFPFPKVIDEYLTNELKSSWLPSLIGYLYKGFNQEINQTLEYREELSKIYHHHRTSEMIHLLSQYIKQLTPNFLLNNSELISGLLLDPLHQLLPLPKEQLKIMQQLLQKFFLGLGENESEEIQVLFEFLQKYVEAFILKKFLYFSNSTKDADSEDKKTKIALLCFEKAKEHFKAINEYKNKIGQKHASRIPYEVMSKHFRQIQILHPALDEPDPACNDPTMNKREFYKPLIARILPIFDVNSKADLPAPSFLQPTLWLLVIEMLMPIVAEQLFTLMMEPHSLHKYLQALLKSINQSLKVTNEQSNPSFQLKRNYEDSFQEELEDNLGSLILELVGLQPMMLKGSFNAFKDRVGKVSGESMRKMIDQETLLQLFDRLFQLTALLHPGGWANTINYTVSKQANAVPLLDPNGDVFVPIKEDGEQGWDFKLPKNKEELEQATRDRAQWNEQTKDSVEQELSGMIEQQAYLSLQSALNELWRKIQENMDQSIKDTFGDLGAKFKDTLDQLCRFIWRYVLYPILKIVLFPFKKVTKLIFKGYCNKQAKMRVGDIESKIHRNLMIKILDEMVNILETPAKAPI